MTSSSRSYRTKSCQATSSALLLCCLRPVLCSADAGSSGPTQRQGCYVWFTRECMLRICNQPPTMCTKCRPDAC